MTGIKDIAKAAGVSISTVSYALNGSTKVTEKTRQRIVQIANELNYIPNAAARTLKTRKTHIIGAFLGDYSGSFYGELLKGINLELSNTGYELIVCNGPESHRLMTERIVDGGIILGHRFTEEQIMSFADRGHPLTLLDREIIHPNISCVLLNNAMGMEQEMEAIVAIRPNHIHLLNGPVGNHDAIERREIVMTHALQAGITVMEWEGNFTKRSGIRATSDLLEDLKDGDAIVCLNDDMALGVYDVLQNTSFRIGQDVSLAGFDKLEITNYTHPKIASVSYSKLEWGQKAAHSLMRLIDAKENGIEKIDSKFIVAESVCQRK